MVSYKLDTDLKIWLPMTEGSGSTVNDYSGNSNNATLVNSPTWVKKSYLGSYAIDFEDSSSQYATISSPPDILNSNGNFSISVWVNPESIANTNTTELYGQYTDTDNRWGFGFTGDNAATEGTRIFIRQGGSTNIDIDFAYTHSLGEWALYTLVRNGTNFYFYVNGVQQGSGSDASTTSSETGTARIGWFAFTSTTQDQYYDGLMSDIMVWTRALTQEEIKYLYRRTYRR